MNISPIGSIDGDHVPTASENLTSNERPAKRVRTGCLTCRGRHLKCDEVYPICTQCRKGNRPCVRGMRVRFYEPMICHLEHEAKVEGPWEFRDESVNIASEYNGGLERYGFSAAHRPPHSLTPPSYGTSVRHSSTDKTRSNTLNRSVDIDNGLQQSPPEQHPSLPSIHGMLPGSFKHDGPVFGDTGDSGYYQQSEYPEQPPRYARTPESSNAIANANEALFMQVFIEEMGCWMDSMNSVKYFSHILPYEALDKPMLYSAFLACGARHLRLVNDNYGEEFPLYYYDLATRLLMTGLKNPSNRELCAITAVVLNVYEVMSVNSVERMNHINGSRTLIIECGWNARSEGVAAACFWLHVGMELLSCLHFKRPVAWDTDEWGHDLNFPQAPETRRGMETLWTHRIVYIVTKITNLCADTDKQDAKIRYTEWLELKSLIDDWERKIPRTMRPMYYLQPGQNTKSPSNFPQVWLPERTAVLARVFYHTGMILLSNSHPYEASTTPEMREMKMRNAHILCGIVRHVTDRGIASIAIRSSAIAAECLTERAEQDEILEMLRSFKEQTGWRIDFLQKELKRKWGRLAEASPAASELPQQGVDEPSRILHPVSYHLQPPPAHLQPTPQSQIQHNPQGGMSNTDQVPVQYSTYPPQQQQQQQQHHLPNMQGNHQSNHNLLPIPLSPKGSNSIPSLSTSRQLPRNSLITPNADYNQMQQQFSQAAYAPPANTQNPGLNNSGSGSSMGQAGGANHLSLGHGAMAPTNSSIAAQHAQFGGY